MDLIPKPKGFNIFGNDYRPSSVSRGCQRLFSGDTGNGQDRRQPRAACGWS
jgi:hypothetical protein